jgi:Ca2+-binding EF-hand superfamily protein
MTTPSALSPARKSTSVGRKSVKIGGATTAKTVVKTSKKTEILNALIGDIWRNYDKDGSGSLDYRETRQFVRDICKQLSGSDEIDEVEFKILFNRYDSSKDGTI